MRAAALVLATWLAAAPAAAQWPHFTALGADSTGTFLAAGGRAGEVLLLEASTGELTARWTLPEGGPVAAVLPLGAGRAGAVDAGGRGWVLEKEGLPRAAGPGELPPPLWAAAQDCRTGNPLRRGLKVSAGGWTFTGLPSGRLEAARGTDPPAVWQAAGAALTGLAVLPGPKLVTAGYDGSLVLWDPATGKELGRL